MSKENKIECLITDQYIGAENSNRARDLNNKSNFGEIISKKLQFSYLEGSYLLEKNKIKILDSRSKLIDFDTLQKKASKKDKKFLIKYAVFKDLREKGYIVKTGLKFGADFRIYEKSKGPGKGHSKWIAYCVSEKDINNWQDFSSKNRVAHSTKKSLLIGIVDDEGDVTYYESIWVKP